MKVLFLTYDGLTDQLGQSQILPYLQELSAIGHKISILSLEKVTGLTENKSSIQQICLQSGLDWDYLSFPEKGSKLTQNNTLRKFKKLALSLALKNKVDLTHCRSYPAAMAGLYIQRKSSIPYIFDIRGFWIDERKEGKIWNFYNPITIIGLLWLRLTEKRLFKNSFAIVSLTNKGKELIKKRFLQPESLKEIAVIPCCTDYNLFHPILNKPKSQLRTELSLPVNPFILCYLGSIGTWYLLKEMMEFFSALLISKPNSIFLFISKEEPATILKTSRLFNIPDNRIIIRPASRQEVPLYVNASNCGIAFIRPTFSKQASSPVKWAENLACGIPLIVNNKIGDIEVLREKLKGIQVCEDFSNASFKKIIADIENQNIISSEEITEASRKEFELSIGVKNYHHLYQKCGAKKILFIASHRPERAPNQRFRFEQYIPYFEQEGYYCHQSYLIDESDDLYLYKPGNVLRKAWFLFGKSMVRRFRDLGNAHQYNLVFIAREALMTRSTFFEKRLSHLKPKMIYDFDDSIWLPNVSHANRWFHWMKNPGKTASLISMASLTIAGNRYLADYAHQWSENVTIIPTTVDTEIFKPLNTSQSQHPYITIGWTGSITTIPHFKFIIPVLCRIKEKYGEKVRFEVIGDADFYSPELDIRGKAWSLENEKMINSIFDIGIMPLPDDEWTKGKCGFKGIFCMSAGIAVIMSPVGVNIEIIQDGVNGYLANSEDEWFDKLCNLIDSEELRRVFGSKGRQTVEEKYSVNAWKDYYISIFKELTE